MDRCAVLGCPDSASACRKPSVCVCVCGCSCVSWLLHTLRLMIIDSDLFELYKLNIPNAALVGNTWKTNRSSSWWDHSYLFFISTPKNIHPSKLIYFLYLTVFLMGLFLLSTCGLKHCIHTPYVCLYSWIFDCALMDFWKVNRSVASSLRSTELSLQTHRWLFCAITSKYNLSNVTQTALML